MNLEEGFYWVLYLGRWEIMEYTSDGFFWACGSKGAYVKSEMSKINETRILPPNE